MKEKTITQFCGKEAGSFKKFLEEKEAFSKKHEQKRQERIQAARSSRKLAWVA